MKKFVLNISKRMERVTPKQRFVLVVLFMIVCIIVNGDIVGIEKLKEITGGIGMLDMKVWYSPTKAYEIFESLGEAGREFYVRLLGLDYIMIISFGLMQSAFTTFLLQKLLVPEKWLRLNLLPYVRGVFDFLENCCLLFLVFNYPTSFVGLAWFAGILTTLKWMAMAASMGVILFALMGLVWKAIKRRVVRTGRLEIEGTL